MSGHEKSNIFRESSMERLSSPEQLKEYIQVTGLSVWLNLAAVFVALMGLLIWGLFGTITLTDTYKGVAENGLVTCYVSDVKTIDVGMPVQVDSTEGVVTEVGYEPVSNNTLKKTYDAFTIYSLDPAKFTYPVTIDVDVPNGIVDADIVVNRARPISYLFE